MRSRYKPFGSSFPRGEGRISGVFEEVERATLVGVSTSEETGGAPDGAGRGGAIKSGASDNVSLEMLSREVLATGEDENSSLAARAAAASQGAGLGDGEGLAEVAGLADPVDTAGGGTSESM